MKQFRILCVVALAVLAVACKGSSNNVVVPPGLYLAGNVYNSPPAGSGFATIGAVEVLPDVTASESVTVTVSISNLTARPIRNAIIDAAIQHIGGLSSYYVCLECYPLTNGTGQECRPLWYNGEPVLGACDGSLLDTTLMSETYPLCEQPEDGIDCTSVSYSLKYFPGNRSMFGFVREVPVGQIYKTGRGGMYDPQLAPFEESASFILRGSDGEPIVEKNYIFTVTP